YSQFNAIIPFENGCYALYNSFEQRVIFLAEELKQILENSIKLGIDTLKEIHPTFFDNLLVNKFLVANNFNEIEAVKKISKKIDNNQNQFLLTINPTLNCNFKCWYCYETHIRNSRIDSATSESIKKFISKTAENKKLKYFHLSFFGGEPLLYFKQDVIPVIEHFLSVCKKRDISYGVGFTTNGYLVDDDLIAFFNFNEIKPSFQITFDGNKPAHDEVRYATKTRGSYDTIVKNCKKLLGNDFSVRARINYTDKNIVDCFRIIDDFTEMSEKTKKDNLIFDFHRVWQNDSVDSTADLMQYNAKKMRDNGFQTSVKFSPNNVLQSCYADKTNSVVINYNGDIYKCTARDFLPENRVGYLSEEGILVWNEGYLERRKNAKFNNAPCLKCCILPLCNGGCSQHALEHLETGNDYCVFHADRGEIERIIKTKIEEILDAQAKKKEN
ncbi:MAG: SPASM domain-containing protein, partial [Prevotellaceae bacterium]|nr:SPASM domain-containing protein [Prevotellaceae bacterium]